MEKNGKGKKKQREDYFWAGDGFWDDRKFIISCSRRETDEEERERDNWLLSSLSLFPGEERSTQRVYIYSFIDSVEAYVTPTGPSLVSCFEGKAEAARDESLLSPSSSFLSFSSFQSSSFSCVVSVVVKAQYCHEDWTSGEKEIHTFCPAREECRWITHWCLSHILFHRKEGRSVKETFLSLSVGQKDLWNEYLSRSGIFEKTDTHSLRLQKKRERDSCPWKSRDSRRNRDIISSDSQSTLFSWLPIFFPPVLLFRIQCLVMQTFLTKREKMLLTNVLLIFTAGGSYRSLFLSACNYFFSCSPFLDSFFRGERTVESAQDSKVYFGPTFLLLLLSFQTKDETGMSDDQKIPPTSFLVLSSLCIAHHLSTKESKVDLFLVVHVVCLCINGPFPLFLCIWCLMQVHVIWKVTHGKEKDKGISGGRKEELLLTLEIECKECRKQDKTINCIMYFKLYRERGGKPRHRIKETSERERSHYKMTKASGGKRGIVMERRCLFLEGKRCTFLRFHLVLCSSNFDFVLPSRDVLLPLSICMNLSS